MVSYLSVMTNDFIKSRYQPTIKILPLSFGNKPERYNARVVELVDTRDLKSLAEKRAGSSPAPGTILKISQIFLQYLISANIVNSLFSSVIL